MLVVEAGDRDRKSPKNVDVSADDDGCCEEDRDENIGCRVGDNLRSSKKVSVSEYDSKSSSLPPPKNFSPSVTSLPSTTVAASPSIWSSIIKSVSSSFIGGGGCSAAARDVDGGGGVVDNGKDNGRKSFTPIVGADEESRSKSDSRSRASSKSTISTSSSSSVVASAFTRSSSNVDFFIDILSSLINTPDASLAYTLKVIRNLTKTIGKSDPVNILCDTLVNSEKWDRAIERYPRPLQSDVWFGYITYTFYRPLDKIVYDILVEQYLTVAYSTYLSIITDERLRVFGHYIKILKDVKENMKIDEKTILDILDKTQQRFNVNVKHSIAVLVLTLLTSLEHRTIHGILMSLPKSVEIFVQSMSKNFYRAIEYAKRRLTETSEENVLSSSSNERKARDVNDDKKHNTCEIMRCKDAKKKKKTKNMTTTAMTIRKAANNVDDKNFKLCDDENNVEDDYDDDDNFTLAKETFDDEVRVENNDDEKIYKSCGALKRSENSGSDDRDEYCYAEIISDDDDVDNENESDDNDDQVATIKKGCKRSSPRIIRVPTKDDRKNNSKRRNNTVVAGKTRCEKRKRPRKISNEDKKLFVESEDKLELERDISPSNSSTSSNNSYHRHDAKRLRKK